MFGVTNDCGTRCPMPEMTPLQELLFAASYLIDVICILWIIIIHMGEKTNI